MSFLAGLLAQVIEWLLTQAFSILNKDYEQYKADKQAAADAKAALDKLKAAQSAEEIDKATDDSLGKL